jgi:hypothetical protein
VSGGQGGEERMRGVLGVRCAAEQYRHVPVPEPVGADRLTALGYGSVRKYAEGIEDWTGAGLPTESG